MNTPTNCILLHGCNVFVVDPKMFEWNVDVLKLITLHGCNVFEVNPKIFVWNVKNPSSSLYGTTAMLLWPTNSPWCGTETSKKCVLRLLHRCNVFVADPEMLVWAETMAQIHDTARLQ